MYAVRIGKSVNKVITCSHADRSVLIYYKSDTDPDFHFYEPKTQLLTSDRLLTATNHDSYSAWLNADAKRPSTVTMPLDLSLIHI